MSDIMIPIPFPALMERILEEYASESHSVFGVRKQFTPVKGKSLPLFTERLEVPVGPAAGPHTQLCQNIIAAYFAGARFFELKTVQTMDGRELAACVAKPCITAEDECYNCEWSTELYVTQALDEYIKAWYALKLLSRAYGWGDPEGFIFNMSVGYDYAGISSPKIDDFIEGLKHGEHTAIWQECRAWAVANARRLGLEAEYIEAISPRVCTSVTLSTLHGCPPAEIERIAAYLIREKKLNTFVKCNPTVLGYDYARQTLNGLGFDYVSFDEHHFNEDLQYSDAVPMFTRLMALAAENGVEFGLKLSNTFPVEVTRGELPSSEMYMSGRSLYPLTIEMARRFAAEFNGKLRLSFSGGADACNIVPLFAAGIWPITVATTLLKPGGYGRLQQLAMQLVSQPYGEFSSVSVGMTELLSKRARVEPIARKPLKPLPSRKLNAKLPLVSCFTAPCSHGCPIGQDIPEYVRLVGEGKYAEALGVIMDKNPLPFTTGTICPHHCAEKCTRNFYEDAVRIREVKLTAARKAADEILNATQKPEAGCDCRVAVVGAGPGGIASAYFLARAGAKVTVFERRAKAGGTVSYAIPDFRILPESIERDTMFAKALGAEFLFNTPAPTADELFSMGYSHIIYAIGANGRGSLRLKKGEYRNVIDFLEAYKAGSLEALGENIVIIGGGNSAMDAARAAKRCKGVKSVRIVYRRDARNMPAEEEELELALLEGVELCELLSPVALENGKLLCTVNVLGEADASGRRSPVETAESRLIPCDTLIAATGERVEGEYLAAQGFGVSTKGLPVTNDKHEGARPRIYAVGDCKAGPATVVEAIADARRATDSILGLDCPSAKPVSRERETGCYAKQGVIARFTCAESEAGRCLDCAAVCTACVQVCPNRANIAVNIPGGIQILHIDSMCNECGNCKTFCPYAGMPYKDKFTLFESEAAMEDSTNSGFVWLGDGALILRLEGEKRRVKLEELEGQTELKALISTVADKHKALLSLT